MKKLFFSVYSMHVVFCFINIIITDITIILNWGQSMLCCRESQQSTAVLPVYGEQQKTQHGHSESQQAVAVRLSSEPTATAIRPL